MVTDFKELRIYELAFEAAKELQEQSSKWPRSEKYAMVDQIRRSSRSVCANIAEAWFKRRYPDHFVNKLSDASSEAAETIVWIGFAQEYDYLDADRASELEEKYRQTIGGLVKMMNDPDPWCGPSSQLKEPDLDYEISNLQKNG
ncbi:MAG: four helix bundle protein [Salinivenus sp.]